MKPEVSEIMVDFVPFEISKKLKEKMFNEQCLAYYTKDSNFYYNKGYAQDDTFKSFNSHPNHKCGKRIDAPTIPQVLKWLRDVKNIHIEIYTNASGYNYIISDIPKLGGTDRHWSTYEGPNEGGCWDSYEEVILSAIEYVIDNLI